MNKKPTTATRLYLKITFSTIVGWVWNLYNDAIRDFIDNVEWIIKEKTTSNMETYVVAASIVPAVHSNRSIDTASLKQLLS